MIDTNALRAGFQAAVVKSGGPGGVAYVGDGAQEYFFEAVGYRQATPTKAASNRETIYDLASLTKVIATTTCTLKLYEAGALGLDTLVTDHVPMPWCKDIRVRHLLTHTAGFVAGKYRYAEHNNILEMVRDYTTTGIVAPPGTRYQYSDIGFMLLGLIVESAASDSLDATAHKFIFEPLGMTNTFFNPPDSVKDRCAATEDCPWRKRVVHGEVHDENAFAVGGVSGHAGLFSTAGDLALFCRGLLGGKVLQEETMDQMLAFGGVADYPWQGLGWKLDPWLSDSRGALPVRSAFGHTGWTGTSMYLDRASDLFAIQLGNTCHTSRRARNNGYFRRRFYQTLAKSAYPERRGVHGGLDRLTRGSFGPLKDTRYGLLTNSAAIDQIERPILNVLGTIAGRPPHIVYSPEHGFARQGEAGEKIASQSGAMPIVSLYGDRKAPSSAELAELKLFVVDLQDIGSRYYTYMHTMRQCIEACAKAKVPVLVLDRPNPLGGDIIEGPMPTVTGSPVCTARIPVRHGMTMGELAQFFAETMKPKPDIEVYRLDNWIPSLSFSECGLPWVAPSPNMPTVETALAYVGTCLLEGVNMNEGRGTPHPFLLFGAPWLKATDVLSAMDAGSLRGAHLEVERYTPVSIEGKSTNPRFLGEECRGIRLHVTDAKQFRPFTLALDFLLSTRAVHGNELNFSPFFDTLAGGPRLREQILAGESAAEITHQHAMELTAFDGIRPKLYTEWAMG